MKKITSIITMMLLITSIATQVAAAEVVEKTIQFTDVSETNWANESIQKLVKAGYVAGYPDGTFKPDGAITRPELVRMVNQVYSYTDKQATTNFTDVKADHWFYNDVLIAQNTGYIKGYPDNTFKPSNNITREELCTILVSINQFVELPYDKTVADKVSPWAAGYVNKIVSNRMMSLDKDNKFRATENATRAEVCEVLAKFVIVEKPVVVVPTPIIPTPTKPTPVMTGGGGGGGGAVVVPEMSEEQKINAAMVKVTERLSNNTMSTLTSDAQKEIVSDIIANMNQYKNNNNYDYKAAANATHETYKRMSKEEQDGLKFAIQISNPTQDLLTLKDFFFPDLEI